MGWARRYVWNLTNNCIHRLGRRSVASSSERVGRRCGHFNGIHEGSAMLKVHIIWHSSHSRGRVSKKKGMRSLLMLSSLRRIRNSAVNWRVNLKKNLWDCLLFQFDWTLMSTYLILVSVRSLKLEPYQHKLHDNAQKKNMSNRRKRLDKNDWWSKTL